MVCIAACHWMSACVAKGSKVMCTTRVGISCLQVSMCILELNKVESIADAEDSSICCWSATIKRLQRETAGSGKCTDDHE